MKSTDRILDYHKHCATCKGPKVDVIQTGYYYCATCWMGKYGNFKQQKRRSKYDSISTN